jgi:hypothetical protein
MRERRLERYRSPAKLWHTLPIRHPSTRDTSEEPADAMKIKRLPAGFVITKSSTGYRLIVRRDRRTVRLDTRNAYGHYACRRSADAARRIKTKISAIAGAAVVLGPGGLSLFDDLRRWEAGQQDGEDPRNLPFPDRKAAGSGARRTSCSTNTLTKIALPRPCMPTWR